MENQSRISDLLQSALDDLLEEDFKRFKDKLSHSGFKGKGTIPRGRLEKADRVDTKNILIAFYGGDAAVDVTIEILAKINVRGPAANLKKDREKVVCSCSSLSISCSLGEQAQEQTLDRYCGGSQRGRSPGSTALNLGGSGFPAAIRIGEDLHPNGKPLELSAKGEHFVNRHRADLIQRVCMVDSIIDMLYGTVLDEEQYQSIRAEKTNPDKMRKLYEFMPSWNWYCKEQLYQALKAKNKFLIEELESK
ncbi:apoptosis-associated speck-like protein containing a CARD isoform X1 [Malaclemys terrapin pileata]|uniref:apoptosis-associated speck-like protein containing a CARD isoform X1 n=1 Tax=Malaclemys terrapin pileata TaxID=2991368 RepID=UPI0023A91011|nr:apoptosis-associated speck-like protein containing a CARD isoform X1 [Malaclemys terrapin pileata]XP_053881945.1 apoptosis-associated speck-like protein containing a CARD isoform X1 [Malaclemys terrapin pileata]